MVMSCTAGMGDVARERLLALWRLIESAHYSYLEMDDSPEKLEQKNKLEGYIMEYLTLVPHDCKFGLTETAKVFQRTVNELPEFSAYRAGLGWAALARYAENLLSQPWRKEYRVIRLYCGYYKHEVEANLVGAELILQTLGYHAIGGARLQLVQPLCPDVAAAVARDALVAHAECQIMANMWESVWSSGRRISWADVARQRASQNSLTNYTDGSEIYSNVNVPVPVSMQHRNRIDSRYHDTTSSQCQHVCTEEAPIMPYIVPTMPPPMMYVTQGHEIPVTIPHCNTVPVAPYPMPYYYPIQSPYMIPTQVYAPIRQASNVPINGYPVRYPLVPTAQLIELDSSYENGKDDRSNRKKQTETSRRNSTSKSGFSDATLPSLPRSDTQPMLSKAKEDGMGTYESWDYVFRNLSSKDQDDGRSRFSPSMDRDSRTLDRLDRDERRSKYQPTTLDLEDGMQALNLDRSYDDDAYRTAKVNENLMRLKLEEEARKVKLAKRAAEEKKKKIEVVGHPNSDALINSKVASDKVRLLTKRDIKDRKDIIKQQNCINGPLSSSVDVKKIKKVIKQTVDTERMKSKPMENGQKSHNARNTSASTNYDINAQLIVSLDETDSVRKSPPRQLNTCLNGERERSTSRPSSQHNGISDKPSNKWECGTCTYLNKAAASACEMCGKSQKGPDVKPLTSGGRECPACTLVNGRNAQNCDACGTSLEHCPTYI